MSARGLAGPVTGQGGGGAALASALNLDLGLDSYFRGSKDEECYGTVRMQPLVYMDDTARASHNMNSMRAGNIKLAALALEKQLQYHPRFLGMKDTELPARWKLKKLRSRWVKSS